MSQEKVLKTLESLGIAQLDARVFVFLAKRGPRKATDVAKSLKMPKQTLYVVIRNLQKKGLVTSTLEHPARFGAVQFEKVLDLFVKAKMEEAQRIQKDRDEILSDWQSIAIAETDETSAKFTVIEGRATVYSKIQQMIQETQKQLSFVTTVPSLVRADQFGLFDAAFSHPLKSKIQFRFITDLSDQNVNAMKALLKKKPAANFGFEGRTPDLGLRLLPRMVIRDEEETMFFIDPKMDPASEKDYVCLWTNCKTLVNSFSAMFEDLWSNSTEIEKKIVEIETGKPTPKTCVITEAKNAKKKYDETLRSARKEIMIMTSSKGLLALSKNMPLLKELTERGVIVRIMASIVIDNLDAARKLKKYCEVRHVPAVYLGATAVDGQHFFQFKSPSSGKENVESLDYFENAFYTNDYEYVKKTESMLNDIWNNAQAPSPIALKAIIQQPLLSDKPSDANILDDYKSEFKKVVGFSYVMEPQQGKITEEEVLSKIANAKRIPAKNPKTDIIRLYGATGSAIIYPPKSLNLPNFMIQVVHSNRKSSFGASNTLFINIETRIADRQFYLPVAFVTSNLLGYKFRKAMHEGIQTTEAIHLLKESELKVQATGNKLFAGWTVPVTLLRPEYVLPPACIIFEGYGEIKSYSSKVIGPLNRRITYEFNTLDAFVTFMHPSSRYYGPGTDAVFHRDIITTSYPAK